MLFGKCERKLDYKGRISLPEDFLMSAELPWSQVVALHQTAHGVQTDHEFRLVCLFDLETWKRYLASARERMDDDEARFFMESVVGDAARLTLDSMKRLTLPASLLRHASLEKEAVIIGVFDHVEVWSPNSYQAYMDSLAQEVEVPSISDLARAQIREVPLDQLRRAE